MLLHINTVPLWQETLASVLSATLVSLDLGLHVKSHWHLELVSEIKTLGSSVPVRAWSGVSVSEIKTLGASVPVKSWAY